ncbi:MAG: hypothetical protein FWD86_02845, partial [Firmicutes bacterium]|nr:hypothetical protein [Bacillota bacterium]
MFFLNILLTINSAQIDLYGSVDTETAIRYNDLTKNNVGQNIDDILNNIDQSNLNNLFNDLDQNAIDVFGSTSFSEIIKRIIDGEDIADFSSIFNYFVSIFFTQLTKMLPFILAILGICVAFSIISSIKGGFSSESIEGITRFACISLVAVVLMGQIFLIVSAVSSTISSL